jgi:DNA-binding MarR family transcriptional regulator
MAEENAISQDQAMELRGLIANLLKLSGRQMEQRLAEHGIELTMLQLGVLRLIELYPDNTLSQLSRHMRLAPATLVPVVDVFVRSGHVARVEDPEDRRRTLLNLTENGLAMMDKIRLLKPDDRLMTALEQLGFSEVQHLLVSLRNLLTYLAVDDPEYAQVAEELRVLMSLAAHKRTSEGPTC